IAPTLPPYRPAAPSAEPLVAWRYVGAGATNPIGGSPYAAKRWTRARLLNTAINVFAGLAQGFSAGEIRGKTIRLRAQARATAGNASSGGALWLRVDRGARTPGFFDNMADRLIRESAWREYSIVGTVADDATTVVFGVMAIG